MKLTQRDLDRRRADRMAQPFQFKKTFLSGKDKRSIRRAELRRDEPDHKSLTRYARAIESAISKEYY